MNATTKDEIERVLTNFSGLVVLSKDEREALRKSLASVTVGEILLAYGLARSVEAPALKIDKYTYYFVTDRGLYFGGKAKTGFMKSETRTAFVAAADVQAADVQGAAPGFNVDMAFLNCENDRGERVLWMSFDDIPGNVASPAALAVEAGEALGISFS